MTGTARLHMPTTAMQGVRGEHARVRPFRSQPTAMNVQPGDGEKGARLDAGRSTTDIGGKGDACSGSARQE